MIERYFIISSDAQISKDLISYEENAAKVNEAMLKLSREVGIEGSEYYPGSDVLGIVPTENDLTKFASQLRKDTYSDGLRLFKKNSEVGKKWMALASEVKPQRKPRLWMYYHFLMGKMRTRLFRIDGTIYCSIENDGQYEKPDEFREIKASEFFKVIEDYEERKNNES